MARLFHDGFELARPNTSGGSGSATPIVHEGLWYAQANSDSSPSWGTGNIHCLSGNRTGGLGERILRISVTSTYGADPYTWRNLGDGIPLNDEHFGRAYFMFSLGRATMLFLQSDNTQLVRLTRTSTGSLEVRVLNNVVGETIVTDLDVWYRLEWHFVYDDVNGLLEIRIDGNSLFEYHGDTKGSTTKGFNRLRFGFQSLATQCTVWYDDIALNDVTGGVNDTWVGSGSCLLLKPKAAGTYTEWTASNETYDNWEMVDEVPHDGDSTYVASVVPDEIDSYKTEELVADYALSPALGISSVKAVQAVFHGRWEDSDVDITPLLVSGGNIQHGDLIHAPSTYMPASQYVFNINPFTNLPWTFGEVDALEVGAQHKARE